MYGCHDLFSLRQLIAEIIKIIVLKCLCTFLASISVVSGKPESKASLPSYLLYLARGYECGGGGTGVLDQVFGQHLTLDCWSAVSDRSSPAYWVMTTFHLSRCTCVTLYNCHLAHPPLPQHYSDMLYDWDSRHTLMYIGIIIIIIHVYTYIVLKVLFDSFGNGH